MKNFLRALLIPIFLLQWVWFLLFCVIFSKQPKQLTNLIQNNEPTEFVEARNYFTDLSDYAVQGNQLYILYDNAAVLEVFNLNGEYLRSYVYPWYQNGSGHLITDGNDLWLIDRNLHRYRFRDGLLIETASDNEYSAYRALMRSAKRQAEARQSDDGAVYTRRGPSVYRIYKGSSTALVKRPFYDMLMQGLFPLIQHGAIILLLVVIVFHDKRIGSHREKRINEQIPRSSQNEYPYRRNIMKHTPQGKRDGSLVRKYLI